MRGTENSNKPPTSVTEMLGTMVRDPQHHQDLNSLPLNPCLSLTHISVTILSYTPFCVSSQHSRNLANPTYIFPQNRMSRAMRKYRYGKPCNPTNRNTISIGLDSLCQQRESNITKTPNTHQSFEPLLVTKSCVVDELGQKFSTTTLNEVNHDNSPKKRKFRELIMRLLRNLVRRKGRQAEIREGQYSEVNGSF
jgi:hypothetical protein